MAVQAAKSPNFAVRLVRACDENAECPPLHQGRLAWLRKQLAAEGLYVSTESIRKWVSGEGRPRLDKVEKLAKVLGVDAQWLYMGPRRADQSAASPEKAETKVMGIPPLPILIRPGVVIEVHGLPLDFTRTEANKVANIIAAHATVD